MRNSQETLKPFHIVTKKLFQIILLLTETVGIPVLFTHFSYTIRPFFDWIDITERFILIYTFYQIFVYVILKTLNDISADSYLELKDNYELALLYCESKNTSILEALKYNVRNQLDSGTQNALDIRQQYRELWKLIEENDIVKLRCRKISAEHKYEFQSLGWRNSFILRMLK